MNNYTTVLFKDDKDIYYIGERDENDEVVNFISIVISIDMKDANTFHEMKLNEFMILNVEKKANNLKLTPVTIGSLSANTMANKDNPGIAAEVHLIPRDKLLEMFNGVLARK